MSIWRAREAKNVETYGTAGRMAYYCLAVTDACSSQSFLFDRISRGSHPRANFSRINSNGLGTNVSGIASLPINLTPAPGDGISCVINNTPAIPSLSITKAASTAGPVSLGQTIIYTYTVTNNGNVSLSNVHVIDMHGSPAVQIANGAGGITSETLTNPGPLGAGASTDTVANDGNWAMLAPGATVQFTYIHTVTQAEIDHG
jgi:Domain of unknown function DUF11